MSLQTKQIAQLLKPINPSRVLQDGKGHSHLAQQDVRAHLIRIFGFGGWDTELTSLDLIHERSVGVDEKSQGRWWVTYRCTMRLTIKDPQGNVLAVYEDGATGSAQNQPSPGDAHDNALKNAISYALKRCAINLGDQYGLALYNRGQTSALVKGLVFDTDADVQDGIEQQVDLGHDDGLMSAQEKRDHDALVREVQAAPKKAQRQRGRQQDDIFAEPLTDETWLASITARINDCNTMSVWRGLAAEVKQEVDLGHVSAVDADLLDKRLTAREIELGEVA